MPALLRATKGPATFAEAAYRRVLGEEAVLQLDGPSKVVDGPASLCNRRERRDENVISPRIVSKRAAEALSHLPDAIHVLLFFMDTPANSLSRI